MDVNTPSCLEYEIITSGLPQGGLRHLIVVSINQRFQIIFAKSTENVCAT